MSDVREVLSALIDREPVDADVLAQVLEDPAHRALLVDFVRLRTEVVSDGPAETGWRPADTTSAPAPGSRLPAPGRSYGHLWLRAAAVFALLAAGAGGGAWVERLASRAAPPEPTQVVKLQPGVDWR